MHWNLGPAGEFPRSDDIVVERLLDDAVGFPRANPDAG